MYEVKKDFNAYYLLWIFVILAVFGFTIYFYSCGEKLPSNREGVDSVRNELESVADDSRRSKIESKLQKEQLAILKHQLSESDSLLTKQEVSLKNANILLMRYEDEQKKESRR